MKDRKREVKKKLRRKGKQRFYSRIRKSRKLVLQIKHARPPYLTQQQYK